MMIRRRPAEAAAAPARDPYAPDGAPNLAATLDKGFPYDDWVDISRPKNLDVILISCINILDRVRLQPRSQCDLSKLIQDYA